MKFNYDILDDTEKIIFALRSLYHEYGYRVYKMGKFEDYDLYSRNKDFLISENLITFTDTNGRLKALKPDVTLSIIKNNRDDPETTRKLCYNENVYRVSQGGNAFREIMQTGLECMGKVDEECIAEVLLLAAKSLSLLQESFALEISDLDILLRFVEDMTDREDVRRSLLRCVSEKNLHALQEICTREEIAAPKAERLGQLMQLYGPAMEVIPRLKELGGRLGLREETERLERILQRLAGSDVEDRIRIDFSVMSNTRYYNGVTFQGFLAGLPRRVLSGGQYNRLMRRMGKTSDAVGFAVYLDELDRLDLSGRGAEEA